MSFEKMNFGTPHIFDAIQDYVAIIDKKHNILSINTNMHIYKCNN
jgi:hypothetical protein